jgi:hypothetical protein
MTLCGIQDVLAKGKVHETFDIFYVMTRKASCEMEIKKTSGKNEIICMVNTVKGKR